MTTTSELEVGRDGYPLVWHTTVKHQVREEAGHRCVRCRHPYRRGAHGNGEWSLCDGECRHPGPIRVWLSDIAVWEEPPERVGPQAYTKHHTTEARWRILTVHHLDGDKTNLRWWNLAALCQRCHLTIQGKVQMARIYPFEHTPWFQPYVAGYYAWVYLQQDLTRVEVEARLDELLALERAA